MKFPAILASAALVASASALGSAEEHGHAHVARHSNRERRFGSPVARAIQARANNAGKFGGFGGGFGGQQNKGGNGGKVTTTAAKVSTTVANGGGGTNKQTTTTVAAVTTTNAAAATTTTTAASSTGGSTISCGTDPQTSHCLDPSVIMPGLALDGLQVPELNEVASLTSTNNYINFCLTQGNLPLTNGAQVKTGSCNQTPMGVIPAQTNMVSSKFVFPTNGGTIAADTDFTVQMAIQNLETGNFVNAASNYYAAPQQVNSAGIVIGHSHVVIEALDSLDTTVASDPTQFSFFKGLNDAAVNGILTADVTGGLAAGFYKISSINTAANHQPFLAPVAQHGSLDDCVYFTVTASGAASGGNGAAAGGNGGGNAAATTTTAAAAVTTTTTAAAATTTTAAAAGNGGNGQSNNGQGNKGGNGGNGNAGNGGNNAIVAKTVTSTIQACAATPAAKLLAKRLADLEQLEA